MAKAKIKRKELHKLRELLDELFWAPDDSFPSSGYMISTYNPLCSRIADAVDTIDEVL